MSQDAIINAVARGLGPLKAWSGERFYGTRGEKLVWLQHHEDAPQGIIEALHEAGFAIVPMGGTMPVRVSIAKENGYRTRYRVQLEMPQVIAGAEQSLPEPMNSDPEFRQQHLPRILARVLLSQFEQQVGQAIAQGIEGHRAEDAAA